MGIPGRERDFRLFLLNESCAEGIDLGENVPDFCFYVRPRIWVGADALLRLPLLAGELTSGNRSRCMLVVDPLLYESKTVDRVRSLLEEHGIQVLVFDDIADRATSRVADDALRLARGSRAPLIIALGGLKTLMVGRAAAALALGDRDLDAVIDGVESKCNAVPLIEIPTSLRHPFLSQDCIVLPDGRDRRIRLIRIAGSSPSAVLIDPGLSASLSPKLSASCVIDSLLGTVEAYVSSKSSFMSDIILEKSAASLALALNNFIARPDDPAARTESWKGSFLSALGQGMSAPGIGTAVALAINARWPVPKAAMAAIFLPYSMELASKSRPEKVAALAALFGEDVSEANTQEAASKSIEWLRTRLGLLKVPSRLKDFDLVLDRLIESARDARELDFMNYLPRAASVDDVFDFVKTAF
jgi:alcohol dehydrogenase